MNGFRLMGLLGLLFIGFQSCCLHEKVERLSKELSTIGTQINRTESDIVYLKREVMKLKRGESIYERKEGL